MLFEYFITAYIEMTKNRRMLLAYGWCGYVIAFVVKKGRQEIQYAAEKPREYTLDDKSGLV